MVHRASAAGVCASAKTAVARWVDSKEFKAAHTPLFGKNAPESWTVTIMSSLKAKVHEIRPGLLKWILSTALPLRDDFSIHLNGQKLVSSKAERGRLKSWRLGKDLKKLPKPCPPDVEPVQRAEDNEYGLSHPAVGFMHGYVETYKDLLTGKRCRPCNLCGREFDRAGHICSKLFHRGSLGPCRRVAINRQEGARHPRESSLSPSARPPTCG